MDVNVNLPIAESSLFSYLAMKPILHIKPSFEQKTHLFIKLVKFRDCRAAKQNIVYSICVYSYIYTMYIVHVTWFSKIM